MPETITSERARRAGRRNALPDRRCRVEEPQPHRGRNRSHRGRHRSDPPLRRARPQRAKRERAAEIGAAIGQIVETRNGNRQSLMLSDENVRTLETARKAFASDRARDPRGPGDDRHGHRMRVRAERSTGAAVAMAVVGHPDDTAGRLCGCGAAVHVAWRGDAGRRRRHPRRIRRRESRPSDIAARARGRR